MVEVEIEEWEGEYQVSILLGNREVIDIWLSRAELQQLVIQGTLALDNSYEEEDDD